MRLAAAQMSIGKDPQHNIQKIINFLGRAAVQGVDLVTFPEMCLTGYYRSILQDPDLRYVMDDALARLHEECRMLGIGAIIGHPYPDGDILRNRATVLLPDERTFSYDKMYLVEEEKKYFLPGDTPMVFPLGETNAGTIICRDQNHPDLARALSGSGATILFILAAHYYPPKEARWKVEKNRALPIARAVENQMYVVLANTIGPHVGRVSLGNSLIADPDGAVIVSAGEADETLISFDHPSSRVI